MQKWAWALLKPGGHTPPDAEPPCPKVMLSHEVPFWWTVEARKSTTPQTPQLHIGPFSIEPPVAHARLSAILHGTRTSLSLPITHYPASFPSLPPVWILGILFSSTPCFLTLSQTLLSWELLHSPERESGFAELKEEMKQHWATSRDHSKKRGTIVGSYVGCLWHSLSGSEGIEPNSVICSLRSFCSPERVSFYRRDFLSGKTGLLI